MKDIIVNNIPNGKTYKLDYTKVRKEIFKFLEGEDKDAALEKVVSIENRNIDFAFKFSAIVKRECGHWEHLQLPYLDGFEQVKKGRCTRCICGESWRRAGLKG